MYNWYTTKGDTLCPIGWHVPSDAEWTILTNYLGGESVAGGRMKSTGTTLWNFPNTGDTNESSFTAYPSGIRSASGSFAYIGQDTFFWSSSYFNNILAWYFRLGNSENSLTKNYSEKSVGASIRCLRN